MVISLSEKLIVIFIKPHHVHMYGYSVEINIERNMIMPISIHFNGKQYGHISKDALPAFILLCENYGLSATRKEGRNKLYLESALYHNQIYLRNNKEQEDVHLQSVKQINSYLSFSGLKVHNITEGDFPKEDGQLFIDFTFQSIETESDRIYIKLEYNSKMKEEDVNRYFFQELYSKPYELEMNPTSESPVQERPYLSIQITIPANLNPSTISEQFAEKISTCILRFLLKGKQEIILSLFPFSELVKAFERSSPDLATPNVSSKRKEEVAAPKSVPEKPIAMPSCEVYFDYTLLPIDQKDEYKIIGSLMIKNTGNVDLINPTICLRIKPADKMELRGKILPPNLSATLAVQTSTGAKGWQYVSEDWYEKALENGDYWIQPIQSITIPPQGLDGLTQFQLEFEKPTSTELFMVEGFVHFERQQLKYVSNNRIAVSFHIPQKKKSTTIETH